MGFSMTEAYKESAEEQEAWKVAQIAAPLVGRREFNYPISKARVLSEAVETAREILAEARRQVTAASEDRPRA